MQITDYDEDDHASQLINILLKQFSYEQRGPKRDVKMSLSQLL